MALEKKIPGEGEIRHLGVPYKVRSASAEEYWSCLQRFVSFDEPGDRVARLYELSAKQIKYPAVNSRIFEELPRTVQESIFRLAFGGNSENTTVANKLLNAVLALEDIERYSPVSFEAWYCQWWRNEDGKEIESNNAWLKDLAVESAQMHWLYSLDQMQLDFTRINSDGPWLGDTRAAFFVACLEEFENRFHEFNAKTIVEAQACFREVYAAWRNKLPGTFLPQLLLIVEGQTEALLIPYLTRNLGIDLDSSAVLVAPVGGAKQAARRYLDLRDLVDIPIVVILDNDAAEESQLVMDMLRPCDRLHVLSSGEIEDVFEKAVVIELLNRYLQPYKDTAPITLSDLDGQERRTVILNRLWRARGLGDFDKVGFAKSIVDGGLKVEQIPLEIKVIANLLKGAISG
ncbi:MAG: ATP-dependent endonuclease [Candidatus Obscuribacterales bacterium]|nr:ATP-dependent endonuclease [Candidatus Obscuribacterales bacterium]